MNLRKNSKIHGDFICHIPLSYPCSVVALKVNTLTFMIAMKASRLGAGERGRIGLELTKNPITKYCQCLTCLTGPHSQRLSLFALTLSSLTTNNSLFPKQR